MSLLRKKLRGGKFWFVLVIFLLTLLLSPTPTTSANDNLPDIGLGAEFVPFLVDQKIFYPELSAKVGAVGAEFGGNSVSFKLEESYSLNSTTYHTRTNSSLGFYLATLKYYFRNHRLIRPHLGAGFINIGMHGQGELRREYDSNQSSQEFDLSTNIGAYNFLFGIDLPLESFDIPLVLTAGINHYRFHSLSVDASMKRTYEGEQNPYLDTHEERIEESFDYTLSLFHYHFGMRYEF